MWGSNLAHAFVPQTYNFLELVNWCAGHYLVNERVVMYFDGSKIVCPIHRDSIVKMLNFPKPTSLHALDDDILVPHY